MMGSELQDMMTEFVASGLAQSGRYAECIRSLYITPPGVSGRLAHVIVEEKGEKHITGERPITIDVLVHDREVQPFAVKKIVKDNNRRCVYTAHVFYIDKTEFWFNLEFGHGVNTAGFEKAVLEQSGRLVRYHQDDELGEVLRIYESLPRQNGDSMALCEVAVVTRGPLVVELKEQFIARIAPQQAVWASNK